MRYMVRALSKHQANPSASTMDTKNVDTYSTWSTKRCPRDLCSKIELKGIAMRLAEKNKMSTETIKSLFIEVDRMKSSRTVPKWPRCCTLKTAIKKCCKNVRDRKSTAGTVENRENVSQNIDRCAQNHARAAEAKSSIQHGGFAKNGWKVKNKVFCGIRLCSKVVAKYYTDV